MMIFQTRWSFYIVFALIAAFGLAGCNKGESKQAKSGQSIVRVNDTEITVHQVNAVLQTTKVDAEKKLQTSQKIVSGLIDQALLVEAARDMKLDRNPNVMTAIEAAKKKILAQAYIQNKVANLAKPTDAEIQTYLKENPNVFENRKIYAMDELAFTIKQQDFVSLEALSDQATTLTEVIDWLKEHHVEYTRKKAIHTAERLPKKLLDKMSALSKGELIFVNSPDKVVVGQLIDSRKQPVTLEQSKNLIEMALTNQKRQQAAKKELERLKKQAKIEFLDSKYDSQVAKTDVKAPVKEAKPAEEDINAQIEKGLSGL